MARSGRGRSPRHVTALMMAVVGAGVFLAFLLSDLPGREDRHWSELPTGLFIRYVVAMAAGGAVAGWLLAGLFGRHGLPGWLLATLGAVAATMVAGLVGSALGLVPDLLADGWQTSDLIPIVFGLAVLPLAFVGNPGLFLAWLLLMGLTHLWARRLRGPAPGRV